MISFKKYPFALMAVFIWIGFVCSISFMEAWLKFHATHVTLPIGLSIGRLVFNALNKVEWVFALIIFIDILLTPKKSRLIFFILPAAILIIQTFLILPALNARVEIVLQGQEILPSFLHFYYLLMELIKVGCLFIYGLHFIPNFSR